MAIGSLRMSASVCPSDQRSHSRPRAEKTQPHTNSTKATTVTHGTLTMLGDTYRKRKKTALLNAISPTKRSRKSWSTTALATRTTTPRRDTGSSTALAMALSGKHSNGSNTAGNNSSTRALKALEEIVPTDSSALSSSSRSTVLEVDSFILGLIKAPAEDLLRNHSPCTVSSLATALLNDEGLFDGIRHEASVRGSSTVTFDTVGRLQDALRQLETHPTSFTTKFSTWIEAERALERVVRIKDETEEEREESSHRAFAAILSAKRSVGRIMGEAIGLMRGGWNEIQEIAQSCGDEEELIEKGREDLEKEYEAHEERTEGEAVIQLKERMEQESKEAEAEELASSLLRPLSDEEQEIANEAIYGVGPLHEVIRQVGTDSVQRGSLHRLQPAQWLNDEVIHYFLVMLSIRDATLSEQESGRPRCHFFKSFFMTKLLNEGNANPALDGKYEYRNVKRWSKKVPGKDIFKLDKIVFPINQGNAHWVCAVAFMQEKKVQMFDSMGAGGSYHLDAIFRYIQDEHKDKKKSPLPNPEEWTIVPTTTDTPRQKNGEFPC